ncbi:MAG: double-strand break repair protein AddB [Rhodothalassiaceae bacterium]
MPGWYTMPTGAGFVDALAETLLSRAAADPLALADTLILLPNRRAAKALQDSFLRLSEGRPLALPRLRPIGDIDEPALELTLADALDVPEAMSEQRRLMLLARLIQAWAERTGRKLGAGQDLRLARSLAELIDAMQTEGLDPQDLSQLVAEDHAAHWQLSLDFLQIAIVEWPTLLASLDRIDPAARRDRLLRAQAQAWAQRPPQTPVIAAGSTGTIPATADLLIAVGRLPNGAVLLPGLDQDMDEVGWQALDVGHSQYALRQLLDRAKLDRQAVQPWPLGPRAAARTAAVQERVRVVRRALDPPALVDRWAAEPAPAAAPRRIDLPTARHEAAFIALVLAEALQIPGRTVALVTPDRALARQVRAELSRWGIQADDSAGEPLDQSEPGRFLRLILDAARDGFGPVALLSLLKHPLCALNGDRAQTRGLARDLEMRVLRGVRPSAGLDGLARIATDLAAPTRAKLADLITVLRGIARSFKAPRLLLDQALRAHLQAAEALSRTEQCPDPLWRNEAGEALGEHLAQWIEAAEADQTMVVGADYPAMFDAMLEGAVVRPAWGGHPRLAIWGPIEARLQHADRLVLGGLNDGIWPPDPGHNPWLSRPMRQAFGLPPLERRIGQSAHDFAEATAAPEVILTRAERVDHAPTVPSRWLTRLAALGAGATADARLAWLAALERPDSIRPTVPPRPCPPASARPRQLSVTQIERLMRDPYGLYAQKILQLTPLDPLEADPAGAEKGQIIHKALEHWASDLGGTWPDTASERLIAAGEKAFAALIERPAVQTFWWPRFLAMAHAVVAEETLRRAAGHVPIQIEAMAVYPVAEGFTLTARADRIDRLACGGLDIIDYKTGQVPSVQRQKAGYAPQLPLEGWLAESGAFTGGQRASVACLSYWKLSGGKEPLNIKPMDSPQERIAQAHDHLLTLIRLFAQPETPYRSQPQPDHAAYGDYDHLARLAEWRDSVETDIPWD